MRNRGSIGPEQSEAVQPNYCLVHNFHHKSSNVVPAGG